MLSSIISRGQGVANSGARTGQIEQGIFQDALRNAIMTTDASGNNSTIFSSYLNASLQSSAEDLLNATADASIPMDRFSIGNALLYQYKRNATGVALDAIEALKKSTDLQTRNSQGGFWYYQAYHQWSYLDGMYSLPAWYIHYATLYEPHNLTAVVDDVVNQFDLLWSHDYHPSTGLLVHGYDESKTAVWANPVTGASSIVWGRSLGWYLTGLVETLEVLPKDFVAAHFHLQSRFRQLVDAIIKVADDASGVWWQVLDQGGRQGNYLESSASALFTYSILKGARLGYLTDNDTAYISAGERAWKYMRDHFVVPESNGTISWNETVAVCSLNSSATYEYYVSQPINFNGLIGSSAFVLASLEYERLSASH
ncbi:glycosyl hydrolase [Delphinella strobiligena]|nr:glycosyl hydrolase [Delphinella strobiligena]